MSTSVELKTAPSELTRGISRMDKIVVNVADTLKLCQAAIRSEEPALVDAAESVMSAMMVWLRYDQALLSSELAAHIKTLRDSQSACIV